MLIDISNAVGGYLHDVFRSSLDWWVLLGFVAQAMFTGRFVVQWLASERAGKSVIPMAFWFLSIGGGLLLLAYALYRRDAVFIAGQLFSVLVYLRNLQFVIRERRGLVSPKLAKARRKKPQGSIQAKRSKTVR